MTKPTKPTKWAYPSSQYLKHTNQGQYFAPELNASKLQDSIVDPKAQRQIQKDATGVSWTNFDVEQIKRVEPGRSRYRFISHLPDLIWNAAALEGNLFTLPEVKTLLEGVTVGGKRLFDEEQILALSAAYNRLDELIRYETFCLSKKVSDELHSLLALHEASEAGHFRGEGTVQGGGTVSLAGGGSVAGTDHGKGGRLLTEHFDRLIEYLQTIQDPRRRSLIYFVAATRRQFYFDGNKRTARLMMTGELMSHGYDIVSVPYSRSLEYNNALDILFKNNDASEFLRFLGTCAIPDR